MALDDPALPEIRVRRADDVRVLFAALTNMAVERCAFAYLDPEWRLLGQRLGDHGSAIGATMPLRAVIADALALNAAAVVMAHNHPSGDPTPSTSDIATTRRLVAALEAIDVRLADHVVLTAGGYVSMRELGLL